MTAAGGLPGELNINWLSQSVASFDCEYGFSCMGYEIAGAWGAAFARRPTGEVFALVGDGSYLMLNSEIYSSVLSGRKFVLVVCDNGGFAVIERLQRNQGGGPTTTCCGLRGPGSDVRVDFVAARRRRWARTPPGPARSPSSRRRSQRPGRTTAPASSSSTSASPTGPRAGCSGRSGCPRSATSPPCARPGPRHEAGMATQRRGI